MVDSELTIPAVDRASFPASRRISVLQETLTAHGFAAALISQPRSLYYYSGVALPAILWVPADAPPLLLTRRVHQLAERAVAAGIQTAPAPNLDAICRILRDHDLLPKPGALLGVELDVTPAELVERLRQAFPTLTVGNVAPFSLYQRAIKDPEEAETIERAAQLWPAAHAAVVETLRSGVSEFMVAAAVEYALRSAGSMGQVWFRRWDAALPGGGIVASGPCAWIVSGLAMTVTGVGMSPALPWGASRRTLTSGDLVVVDYGICVDGYHADIARTYCVGRPSAAQYDLWQRLLEIHHAVTASIRPGLPAGALYESALRIAQRAGVGAHFMGVAPDLGTYVGHGIGLELDEWPLAAAGQTTLLEAGMVLSIEPKLLVPGLGAVAIEDDFVVTGTGSRRLSPPDDELLCVG